MACWVVPAVAAELWGISVQQVLDRVKAGKLECKRQLGFTMVDIAPNSPSIRSAIRLPSSKPRTWTHPEVTPEELAALHDTPLNQSVPDADPSEIEISSPESDDADDFYEEGRIDWRTRRLEVSRTRRRPGWKAPIGRQRTMTAA